MFEIWSSRVISVLPPISRARNQENKIPISVGKGISEIEENAMTSPECVDGDCRRMLCTSLRTDNIFASISVSFEPSEEKDITAIASFIFFDIISVFNIPVNEIDFIVCMIVNTSSALVVKLYAELLRLLSVCPSVRWLSYKSVQEPLADIKIRVQQHT